MNSHLSGVQISEWLAGEHPPESERHLQQCAKCRGEVEGFASGLAALGATVRYWAAQDDRTPNLELQAQRDLDSSRWRWAFAVLGIGALALLPLHWNTVARRDAALRRDAELLEHIQAQLSRAVPATMEPLMSLMQEGQEGKDEHE